MKVHELIEVLSKEDPDAEAVILGERSCYFPVVDIRKLLLKPVGVYQQGKDKLASAYKDTMKNDEGESCIELRQG